MIFLLLFQLIFQKEQITNSFVTKCSANNYHLAIDNATPISTGEFNTDSESENIEVNNDFVYNSPVVISYDFVTIDFARAFVGGCIPLRGRK